MKFKGINNRYTDLENFSELDFKPDAHEPKSVNTSNSLRFEEPQLENSYVMRNALMKTDTDKLYVENDYRNILHNQNSDVNQYFNSCLHSLIQLDENLCIKTFTQTVKNQINIKETDIGRPISDLTNTIRNIDLVKEVKSVLTSKKTLYKQAESINGKWYSLLIEPLKLETGILGGGVNIAFHDITMLTLSKKEAEKDNEKLIKINKDHENFIYSVSHDLKAPLNSIEAIVTLINQTNDVKSIKELTNPLMKSVVGLRQTISELSDITKIEQDLNGEESVKIEPLIEEIKWSLRDLLINSYAIFNVDLKLKYINFSRKNLRSIIYNLLSNAIKYKSNNRQLKIDVEIHKEPDFVVLSISDNGIGISEEELDSIFSKFKRISAGEDIEGSGIGLFLVSRIVSNAGGEIKVHSKLGKGSIFEVFLPNEITTFSE